MKLLRAQSASPLSVEQKLLLDTVAARLLRGELSVTVLELAEELDWERARAQRVLNELVSLGCLAKVTA